MVNIHVGTRIVTFGSGLLSCRVRLLCRVCESLKSDTSVEVYCHLCVDTFRIFAYKLPMAVRSVVVGLELQDHIPCPCEWASIIAG